MDEYVKETLGQYLRREREARHISLEDIPVATRISSPFIRALEENNFDFFSQQEAIPGYLKLYARHLGLDYEDVLRRYMIQSDLNNRSKAFQQLPLFLDFASPIKQAEQKKWPLQKHMAGIVIATAAAFMLVGVSLYLYLMPGKAKKLEEVREPVPAPSLAQKEPLPVEPARPAEPQAATEAPPSAAPQAVPQMKAIEALPPASPPQPAPAKAAPLPAETNAVNAQEVRETPAAAPAQTRKKKVIGNSDSKRYHLPGMKFYNKVKAYHRVEFDSEKEAIKAGYNKARE